MIRKNKVKQILREGGSAIGTFVKTTDASAVEIMGMCGFDFFVIDSEHVSYNPETITDLVRVSDISGIVPIVRIKESTPVNVCLLYTSCLKKVQKCFCQAKLNTAKSGSV